MLAHDVLRKGGNFKVRRLADKTSKYPKEILDFKSLDLNQYDDVQEINPGYYNF